MSLNTCVVKKELLPEQKFAEITVDILNIEKRRP